MTNVSVKLAKDAEYQNLVVKGQATFETGFFGRLHTNAIDATDATIDTLTIETLNQSNSVGNPFSGVTLAPNELVALTSTKSLTTYPYSTEAIDETVVQRPASNGINANYLAGSGSSNQLVLGTDDTISFNAVANGFNGGLGFGTGSSAATQLTLSGSSSVVNSRAGVNRIAISDDNGSAMTIRTMLDSGSGRQSDFVFATNDAVNWNVTSIDLGSGQADLELRYNSISGPTRWRFRLASSTTDPVEMSGRLLPDITNTHSLGTTSKRWGQLFMGTQTLTGIGGSANFTDQPATGLGTTTSLTTAAQAAASITYTNGTQLPQSPIFFSVSAYAGTTGIPMFQYNNTFGSVILINVSTGAALNGTATFSFGILNGNGIGP